MLQQKIISKNNQIPQFFAPNKRKKRLQKKSNPNLKRSEFKTIPYPSKFLPDSMIYYLYGYKGIMLVEKNSKIYTDVSLLTNFNEFRNIEVKTEGLTKLVQVTLEQKLNLKLPSWRDLVQSLTSSINARLYDWARTITNYCTKYENFIKTLQEKSHQEEKEDYTRITKETEIKRSHLLASFPCIYLKTKYEEGVGIQPQEISFNSRLLREIGHSQESFITTIFQEGIPQILSHNAEFTSKTLKLLLDNYFTLDEDGLTSSEHQLFLFMKSNYTKDVLVQTHFLPNYEGDKFGIDTLIVIKPIGEPFLEHRIVPKMTPKKEFLKTMIEQERLQADFLSKFYNTSFDLRFAHRDKVCQVKELSVVKEEYSYYDK